MTTPSKLTKPLLPEHSGDAAGEGSADVAAPASALGAVFNVSTSIVGAGMMSVPAAMRVLGVVPTALLMCFAAAVAGASAQFMLKFTKWSEPAPSYAAFVRAAFGDAGGVAVNAAVALTTAGTLVVYLIIFGDVVSGTPEHTGVLEEWFGPACLFRRAVVVLLTVVLILLPLALLRRVDSLKYASSVSIILAAAFMVITVGMSIYASSLGKLEAPALFPDFATLPSLLDLFTAVPAIVVAFTFHFNVHPIRAELSTNREMTSAVRASLLICSAIYLAVGFSGYLLFGDDTKDDVLINFDNTSALGIPQFWSDAARVSYALHLLLVFPLLLFSLRINAEELLFPSTRCRRPLADDDWRFYTITGALLAIIYIPAVSVPSISAIFRIYGATAAVLISMVFPATAVLKNGRATVREKVSGGAMLGVALVTSSLAIAQTVMNARSGN